MFRTADTSRLYVFDIDHTLLRMPSYLGSDPWFRWHRERILGGIPNSIPSMESLFWVQEQLFRERQMVIVDPGLRDTIALIQRQNCCTMVMTSRGHRTFDATERELKLNGYEFETSCPVVSDLENSPQFIQGGKVTLYRKGVLYTAGQHKGAMLRWFLEKAAIRGYRFNDIALLDDSEDDCRRVQEVGTLVPEIRTFHYQGAHSFTLGFDDHVARSCDLELAKLLDIGVLTLCREKPVTQLLGENYASLGG